MSSSGDRKQTRVQKLKPQTETESGRDKAASAPELTAEMDLTADLAQQLQPAVGNEALRALMGSEQDQESELSQGAAQEEEQLQDVDAGKDDELDLNQELDIPSFGGSPGAPGTPGAPADNPWSADQIFGGDDDPESPTSRPRKRPKRRRPRKLKSQEELIEQAKLASENEGSDAVAREVSRQLPRLEQDDTIDRSGDACFTIIEDSLSSPAALGRPQWKPEDLVDSELSVEPLMMGAEVGSFLSEHGTSLRARSISRLLSSRQAALIPPIGGYSGAAARVASLTTCAQAEESKTVQQRETDGARARRVVTRAVHIAMEWDAWPDTVEQARGLATQGKLHAPLIFQQSHGDRAHEGASLAPSSPHPLIRAAIDHVLPVGFLPPIPDMIPPRSQPDFPDPSVAELDAVLTRLTSGGSSQPETDESVLESRDLQPCLYATRHLLNAIGRMQVEAAAGALAIANAEAGALLLPLLERVDQVLRGLARGTVQNGKKLSALAGQPKTTADTAARESIQALREIHQALGSLQEWTKRSLAASVSE